VAFKGSPNSSGVFWNVAGYPPDESVIPDARLKSLLAKEKAIRTIFNQDGKLLEIQPWDGSAATKFNCRVKEIRFPEGIWFDYVDYEIILEADAVVGEDEFTDKIQNPENNWEIEFQDDLQSFRLTHTVSAVGKAFYNSAGNLDHEPWQNARTWATGHLGLDLGLFSSGVWHLPAYYGGYNRQFSETIEEWNGRYGVVETYILSSGTALEDFTVSKRTSVDQGKTNVAIEGNIKGLNTDSSILNPSAARFTNAQTKFTTVQSQLLNRAQTYAGITLNPIAIASNIGTNPITGTIQYNYEYDNRPTNLIPGALTENISVTFNNQSDVFAQIGVLGRSTGPILQNINTKTAKSLSVEISYTVTVPTGTTITQLMAAKPDIGSIASGFMPVAEQVFKDRHAEVWSFKDGRGSATIGWVYE